MKHQKKYQPRLIAWEVTRTCNLHCKHCRANATDQSIENEFSLEEIKKTIDNIAGSFKPIIIITGGEPLTRKDIYDIISYGNEKGLRMVMATCGMEITGEIIEKLKKAGIQRMSLSIDGATPESHDSFRQVQGSFQANMDSAKLFREHGMEFQINTTIYKGNVKELKAILDLAVEIGAKAFHPFLLVPTGRAKSLVDLEIPAEEYESVLEWVAEESDKSPILFKPTCAPHFKRILMQKGKNKKTGMLPPGHPPVNRDKMAEDILPHNHPKVLPHNHPHDYGDNTEKGIPSHAPKGHPHGHGDSMTKGCLGGQSFAFISHTGGIQICGFLDVSAGDLREQDYDFKKIWDTSPLFQDMRSVDKYKGKCGNCEYIRVCGGCRARAYALTGDYMDEEPYCIYIPKK